MAVWLALGLCAVSPPPTPPPSEDGYGVGVGFGIGHRPGEGVCQWVVVGVIAVGIGHAPYVCLERDSLVVVLGGQGCMC